jgi:hypothetical protein
VISTYSVFFSACICKYHSFLSLQFLAQGCCIWTLSTFGRLHNLKSVTRIWIWMWSTGGIIRTGENRITRRKPVRMPIFLTINHTWDGPESNSRLCDEGTVTKNPNHFTAFICQFPCVNPAEITRSITNFSPKCLQHTRLWDMFWELSTRVEFLVEIRIFYPHENRRNDIYGILY